MTDVGSVQAGAVGTAPVPVRPKVQVVPLKGLPIVAAVVVFVIAAIAGNWLWALMFCHVVGGALWTAIDLFVGLIVGPILGRLSLPGWRTYFKGGWGVQRHRRAVEPAQVLDLLDGQAQDLGEVLIGGLGAHALLPVALRALELLDAGGDVDGQPHQARLVVDRAPQGLLDP